MSFEPVTVNVNFASVSVCQCVNVVRLVFCHPHVCFLAKSLFTTVNLVRPVTVYNAKSVNSAHHIRRFFPSLHCTASIHQHFSCRRHENVTSFPYHHQIYFPPLVLNLIFHLRLRSLIFQQDRNFLLEPHFLRTLNMCLYQSKFACFL